MNTNPSPFLFENDFSGKGRAKPDKIAIKEHEAALIAAREEGYTQGYKQGKLEADEVLQMTLAKLDATIDHVLNLQSAHHAKAVELAAKLATTLARKFVDLEREQSPLAKLTAAIEENYLDLAGAPHIVATVAPDLVDATEARIKPRLQSRGYIGKLIVMGDPSLAPGDGRLEWADGGLVLDSDSVLEAAQKTIDTWLQHTHGRLT